MRSNEPSADTLLRQLGKDLFKIVVSGQVETVRCRDVIVQKLITIFNDTTLLDRVVHPASNFAIFCLLEELLHEHFLLAPLSRLFLRTLVLELV